MDIESDQDEARGSEGENFGTSHEGDYEEYIEADEKYSRRLSPEVQKIDGSSEPDEIMETSSSSVDRINPATKEPTPLVGRRPRTFLAELPKNRPLQFLPGLDPPSSLRNSFQCQLGPPSRTKANSSTAEFTSHLWRKRKNENSRNDEAAKGTKKAKRPKSQITQSTAQLHSSNGRINKHNKVWEEIINSFRIPTFTPVEKKEQAGISNTPVDTVDHSKSVNGKSKAKRINENSKNDEAAKDTTKPKRRRKNEKTPKDIVQCEECFVSVKLNNLQKHIRKCHFVRRVVFCGDRNHRAHKKCHRDMVQLSNDKGEKGGRRARGDRGDREDRGDRRERGNIVDNEDRGDKRGKEGRRERGNRGDRRKRGNIIDKGGRVNRGDNGDGGDRGGRGDRGDRGDRSDRGDRGERRDRRERGDRGDMGDRGERGDRGDRGDRGERGDRRQGRQMR